MKRSLHGMLFSPSHRGIDEHCRQRAEEEARLAAEREKARKEAEAATVEPTMPLTGAERRRRLGRRATIIDDEPPTSMQAPAQAMRPISPPIPTLAGSVPQPVRQPPVVAADTRPVALPVSVEAPQVAEYGRRRGTPTPSPAAFAAVEQLRQQMEQSQQELSQQLLNQDRILNSLTRTAQSVSIRNAYRPITPDLNASLSGASRPVYPDYSQIPPTPSGAYRPETALMGRRLDADSVLLLPSMETEPELPSVAAPLLPTSYATAYRPPTGDSARARRPVLPEPPLSRRGARPGTPGSMISVNVDKLDAINQKRLQWIEQMSRATTDSETQQLLHEYLAKVCRNGMFRILISGGNRIPIHLLSQVARPCRQHAAKASVLPSMPSPVMYDSSLLNHNVLYVD